MTLALIRFVNSLLDPLQKRDKNLTLSELAENVGLPKVFVEVRHWGTHETNLPATEVLRDTGIRALDWLWHNYWNREKDTFDPVLSWWRHEAGMGGVVAAFQNNQEDVFESLMVRISEIEDVVWARQNWEPILFELFEALPTFPKPFLDYLVETLGKILSCELLLSVTNRSCFGR